MTIADDLLKFDGEREYVARKLAVCFKHMKPLRAVDATVRLRRYLDALERARVAYWLLRVDSLGGMGRDD